MRQRLFALILSALVQSMTGAESRSFRTGDVQASNAAPDAVATRLVGSPIFPFGIHNVSYSPDGKRLAAGDGRGNLLVWEAPTATLLASTRAHSNWTFAIAWFNDNSRLVSGGGDNLLHLFKVNREATILQATFAGHSNDVHAVVLDAANHTMFSAGDDARILVWSMPPSPRQTFVLERIMGGHEKQITALALNATGSLLASASRDDTVRLWDAYTGEQLTVLNGHTNDVMSVKFSPDGGVLASGSYDGTVCLWAVPSGQLINTLRPGTGWVYAVAFSPQGSLLASATQRGLQIWDVPSGTLRNTLTFAGNVQASPRATAEQISSVVFHPDGEHLAAGSTSGRVYIVAIGTSTIVSTLQSTARPTF